MRNKNVITRIAPSPTGFFHIGTARTALFNYLFSRHGKGKFFLRMEDTDPKRSKKEFKNDIIQGLKWLGLSYDGQIYYQSSRKAIYQKYAQKLIDKGAAYKKDKAIWFKLSSYQDDVIKYHDLIMGDLQFEKKNFNDFVLIKSDGMPLYMFAAVVDDHQMGITHVIRGADHINSTPQQIMLYKLLGFEIPKFAHIPLILNKDRSKMSKRKNPVSITRDFRDKGYLSEAMVNYLALLGWNPKTEKEIFSLEELTREFDLKKINKSNAIFDIEKLNYFNNHYIQKSTNISKLITNNLKLKSDKNKLEKIITVIKPRMNTLGEFAELSKFFFKLPNYQAKLLIFKKSNQSLTLKGLKATCQKLKADNFPSSVDELNKLLQDIVKERKLSNGDVFWPVRVALSGQEKSPSPAEILWVLGKNESIQRINKALSKLL